MAPCAHVATGAEMEIAKRGLRRCVIALHRWQRAEPLWARRCSMQSGDAKSFCVALLAVC